MSHKEKKTTNCCTSCHRSPLLILICLISQKFKNKTKFKKKKKKKIEEKKRNLKPTTIIPCRVGELIIFSLFSFIAWRWHFTVFSSSFIQNALTEAVCDYVTTMAMIMQAIHVHMIADFCEYKYIVSQCGGVIMSFQVPHIYHHMNAH